MAFVIRYWYVIALAFALSIGSAVAVLIIEKDKWMITAPPAHDPVAAESDLPGMSDSYLRWNFETAGLDDIRVKLEAERNGIAEERKDLEILQSQVQSEMEELERLRSEITALKDAINKDFLEIEETEEANIKRLTKVYSEMKPDAAVTVFKDLDIELVVKILSKMSAEPASRILSEMTSGDPDGPEARKAAIVTEMIHRVK